MSGTVDLYIYEFYFNENALKTVSCCGFCLLFRHLKIGFVYDVTSQVILQCHQLCQHDHKLIFGQ